MSEDRVRSEDRVLVEVGDHVATVTLNRPDKHNALDGAMFEAIAAAAQGLADEPGLRAVVLRGAGPSFCSGIDLGSLAAGDGGLDGVRAALAQAPPNRFQLPAYGWLTLPVPVIAAVHGNCLGGGLQIALAADIRIAAPDARLSVMEVRWGLVPDMSLTRTLPRLVGIDVAKELTYTGRVFSGTEARELGWLRRVRRGPAGGRWRAGGRDRRPLARRGPQRQAAAGQLLDRGGRRDAGARGRAPERADRLAQPAGGSHRGAAEAAGSVHRPGVGGRDGVRRGRETAARSQRMTRTDRLPRKRGVSIVTVRTAWLAGTDDQTRVCLGAIDKV